MNKITLIGEKMKLRRSERMVVISNYLINHPYELTSLNTFAEKYESAKSSISEDIVIIKRAFEEIEIGTIETITGAGGGVIFSPSISDAEAKTIVQGLCDQLSESNRILPGGYIYLSDLLSTPSILNNIGRIIAKLPDARLVCCTSPGKTGKVFAQKMHIPHYTDYDSFLHHPDMDAVIIASPNNLHAEQFIKASQAGKNIYIEKPFGVATSTVSSEIRRNQTPRGRYSCRQAETYASERKEWRYYPRKFNSKMRHDVEQIIRQQQWSPEQIVGRFRLEGIPIVGKTTLYTFLHKDKESGGDLYRHTRHHLKYRHKPLASPQKGKWDGVKV